LDIHPFFESRFSNIENPKNLIQIINLKSYLGWAKGRDDPVQIEGREGLVQAEGREGWST